MAGVGALVLAASFTPWFRSRFGGPGPELSTNTASAWQASTWWTAAVTLSAAAALLAIAARRHAGHARHAWHLVAACAATAAPVLTVWQWLTIPKPDLSRGGAWVAADPTQEPVDVGDILRDRLEIIHVPDLHYDVEWGLYAGLAAMALLTVALWLTRPDRAAACVPD